MKSQLYYSYRETKKQLHQHGVGIFLLFLQIACLSLLTSLCWIMQKEQKSVGGIKWQRQSNYPNKQPAEYFQLN